MPTLHISKNNFLSLMHRIHNNYSMSSRWIWNDKITNERIARVGYNHFISNKGEWNNCFSKFSNRVLPPIFISTILQSEKILNLAHYFPYDVKLRILAHSRSFLANQKGRNAIVGAENLLKLNSTRYGVYHLLSMYYSPPTGGQLSWLHSSVGRAMQRYRRGHGFESRSGLNVFSGFNFTSV